MDSANPPIGTKGDQSSRQQTEANPPKRSKLPAWTFEAITVLLLLVLAALSFNYIKHVFRIASQSLPLILPLAVTALSILTRARDLRNYGSFLNICNDVAIGIISFDIWSISTKANEGTNLVMVNTTEGIPADFGILLLLAGLGISVASVVVTNFQFQNDSTKNRASLAILCLALLVYALPFFLLEEVTAPTAPAAHPETSAERTYTAIVEYEDPKIRAINNHYVGRLFVSTPMTITAGSAAEAKKIAKAQFLGSEESLKLPEKGATSDDRYAVTERNVIVFEDAPKLTCPPR
jgi:hypothetical protein